MIHENTPQSDIITDSTFFDIPSHEGYLINKMGEVKSMRRSHEMILRQKATNSGYLYVGLYKDNKQVIRTIHSLVAETFLGHDRKNTQKLVCDHIDGDKQNNHVTNLQVITQRENCTKDRFNKDGLPVGLHYTGINKDKVYCQMKIGKLKVYLGTFKTIEECKDVYQKGVLVVDKYNGEPKPFRDYVQKLVEADNLLKQ